MKLGLLSYGFGSWGGGIDFIKYIASSISSVSGGQTQNKPALILPYDHGPLSWKRYLLLTGVKLRSLAIGHRLGQQLESIFSESYLKETFSDIQPCFDIIGGGSTQKSQFIAARKAFVDVVLPCFCTPTTDISLPWVGYLYDFQHKHLPELFSAKEIETRDKNFSSMLNTAGHILVNSRAVSRDAEALYSGFKAKIHILPFSPCPQKIWLSSNMDARGKYKIHIPYFMLCNQFWKHKDHPTAFRAFARFLQYNNDAMLVCTGETIDYRFPNYITEVEKLVSDLNISSRVRILGHIPKADQISLLKNSLGLIQPTLFEGGPGGGASYDAISLGVPVIASDIHVNREMNCGDITFFRAGDEISLADALHARGAKLYSRPANEILWRQGLARRKNCGKFIFNVAGLATKQ